MGNKYHKITSAGFTLIEVTLVLAISSALAVILFLGFRQSRSQNQFRDAVERVVTRLEQVKNEANSTVNYTSTSPGSENANRILFAKALVFVNNSNQIFDFSVTANREGDVPSGLIVQGQDNTINLPWGVVFKTDGVSDDSNANTVVFARNVKTGILETFAYTTTSFPGSITGANYSPGSAEDNLDAQLVFESPEGLKAVVRVSKDGNISKEYR